MRSRWPGLRYSQAAGGERMSSGNRVRTVSLAGFVAWAGAAYIGRAMPAPQDPDWLFCGRLLSLTCAGRSSDARLLLEASAEGNVLDVWISAPLREDLMARLGERYHERNVCVAGNAAPGLTSGHIRTVLDARSP